MACELQKGVAAFILSIGMMGCAMSGGGATQTLPVEPQKLVADMAAARWEALIKGDIVKAYSYLSPGTRDVMPLDLYKVKIHSGNWKKANVHSVTCEQDQCKVIVVIDYNSRNSRSFVTTLDEDWLRQDGKWWHVARK